MEATYLDMKYLMKTRQFTYQGFKAKVRFIDKVNCKRGYCNIMLELDGAGLVLKKFIIPVRQLEQLYYGEKTFDDLTK